MATTLKGTIWGGVTISATPATVSIPTGSLWLDGNNNTFTVPAGIRVLKIEIANYFDEQYVGVTPGKTYNNLNGVEESYDEGNIMYAYVTRGIYPNEVYWAIFGDTGSEQLGVSTSDFTIYWSPEINKQIPTRKDY